MQDSLHQANLSQPGANPTGNPFSGGAWVSKPWLLAAASVSTVALIAISVWQRHEITELRQTISHLNQKQIQPLTPNQSAQTGSTATRPDVRHSTNGQPSVNQIITTPAETRPDQLPRPDTVYITRHVAAPSTSRPAPPDEQPPSQQSDSPAEQRYATTGRAPVSTTTPNQPKNLNQPLKTETYGATSTPAHVDKTSNNSLVTTNKSTANKTKSAVAQRPKTDVVAPTNSANSPDNTGAGAVPTQANSSGQQSSEVLANYELLNSLPLVATSTNWLAQLAQRAKRMRTAQPTPVMDQVAQKAPASQPVQQPAVRFRVGLAGEVEAHMWSAGIYSEIPLGRRWMLGVGLNRATFLGGTFLTDDDFNSRTHRDFRKEFARGMIPPKDILNIDTRMVRFQVPLNLSYRLPLSRAFTLLPAVGTYLNLTNTEKITFYYRDLPQRSFDQANYTDSNPVNLLDSFTLSTGLEWQGGRWVIQGHPVITVPLQNSLTPTPDPRWQTSTTIGFRARLMYQF